jgi:predicted nuclease with TOPRIM domain
MTDQERDARLESILEKWCRVLDGHESDKARHEEEMRKLRRKGSDLNTKMDRLIEEMAYTQRWIIGAVALMSILTVVNAVTG